MSVSRIACTEVDVAAEQETIATVAQRMAARQVGTLVIVDAQRRPVGILTDRDITVRVVGAHRDPSACRVVEVMSPDPRTIAETATIEGALGLMRGEGVRRLPVVDPEGQLAGIVTLDDVLAHLLDELCGVRRLLERSDPRSLALS
jgi:CBS domain-containing protein